MNMQKSSIIKLQTIVLYVSILLLLSLVTALVYNGTHGIESINTVAVYTSIISCLSLISMVISVLIYWDILRVTRDAYSFTKNQSSYNKYLDNYRLFFDLSKRKVDVTMKGELFSDENMLFDNMTFENIHYYYIKILEFFPIQTKNFNYEYVFKRFNNRVQSFIDVLLSEILRIRKDESLSIDQKVSILDLYKNFILADYINLCKDLNQNKELFDGDFPPKEITNLLKCNTQGRTVFDLDKFLVLYKDLTKKKIPGFEWV